MKQFEQFVSINFNKGIHLTLFQGTPSDWVYPDGT
jgi:hypothetical protein